MVEIIVNADDFGISKGVNYAVFKGGMFGILNSASLMVNQKYTEDAIRISKAVPQLKIGLHLNFTNGYSTASAEKVPLLTDGNGKFVNGFIKLLLLTLLQPRKMKYQIWREVEAQILEMKKYQLSPVHVDGHRHIQMIPLFYKIVAKNCKKYKIPRIRLVNEDIFHTWKTQGVFAGIKNGGIIKYMVLKIMTLYLKQVAPVYFFSILFSCRITPECMRKIRIPKKWNAIEIMVHPGMPEVDKKDLYGISDKNILSSNRQRELEAVLDKNCLKDIVK